MKIAGRKRSRGDFPALFGVIEITSRVVKCGRIAGGPCSSWQGARNMSSPRSSNNMSPIPPFDIIGILKLAKESVESFFAHRQTVSNGAWDGVVLALDKVSELTTLHVKAVAEVTVPILTDGDIAETSHRYTLLVNNPDFPQGYGEARGILDAAKKLPAFRDPAIQEMIRAVLQDLYEFQYGVFTLG